MMTLHEIKQAFHTLTVAEKFELRQFIDQEVQQAPDYEVMSRVQAIFADTPVPQVESKTMDVDALLNALEDMRAGLTESELDELVESMTIQSPTKSAPKA